MAPDRRGIPVAVEDDPVWGFILGLVISAVIVAGGLAFLAALSYGG